MATTPLGQRAEHRLPRLLLEADVWLACAAFLGSLAIYLPTLSPSVVPGDGGELQTLTGVLGISHPTGYPLLLMLNRLFAWLPVGGDLAHRVTLLGALFTAGTALGLYAMLRETGARPVAALSGAWLMAAAPRLWMHASAAEVYPLSGLLIIVGLWLLIRWGNGRVPLWAPMLALGFGLSHHVSVRLFGPAVLAYLLVVQPRLPLMPAKWLPAMVALLLPLATYLYLPFRFNYFRSLPEYTGQVLGIPKLIAAGLVSPHYFGGGAIGLFLAETYSGFFHGGLSIGALAVRDFLQMLRLQFPLLAVPVMLLGAVALFRKHWRVGVLVLLGALATLLIALRFLTMFGEDGDHFIPVYMLLAFCYGIGVDALLAWFAERFPGRTWLSLFLAAAALAVPVYSATTHLPSMLSSRQQPAPRLLTPNLPSGAVIAGQWTDVTPLWYQQRVEGVRPDLWVIQADIPGITILANRAITDSRPFYELRRSAAGLQLLPIPLRDDSAITHPASEEQQEMSSAVQWRGYTLSDGPLHPGDVLEITLFWQALQPIEGEWKTFIHLVGDDNVPVAQVDREPIGPEFGTSQWQPGLVLADPYELALPATLAPGRYRLLFGWYRDNGRLTWANGQDAQLLAEIEVVPQ